MVKTYGKLFLVLSQLFLHCLVTLSMDLSLDSFRFLPELFDSDNVSFDLVIDDFNGRITNLVLQSQLDLITYGDQKSVEHSKIAVGLKDVQQVQSQLDALLEIISKRTRNGANQRLVL